MNIPEPILAEAQALSAEYPGDIVAIYGLNSKALWASTTHETILGYPPSEVIGMNWRDFVAPEDHAHADLAGTDALLHGRSIRFGMKAIKKTGERVSLRGQAHISTYHPLGRRYLIFHASSVED